MSLKDVQAAVDKFLNLRKAQAIAISGKWGSGKTYFWNQAIEDASSNGLIEKYSYVSLFGANNISDLKSAIFNNAVSAKDVATGASSSTWVKNAEEVIRSSSFEEAKDPGRRLLNIGRKSFSQVTPLLGSWGSVASSLSFFAIKNYVICLDDVERKGSGLPLKEILGLVSLLKEQRGCRIIVILNDDELGDDGAVLEAFKEKVFDVEIVFSPSVEECARFVFDEGWEHSQVVIDKVVQLGIRNIRILQRIRRVIEALLPYVQGKDISLTRQLIHSAVLLTWCYNSRDSTVPSYELVKDTTYGTWVALAGKEDKSDPRKVLERVLSGYSYRDSDEFDLQICQFLENGYVAESGFVEVVNSFQERALRDNHSGSFSQAWELFHDTFADNEEELVTTLRERFLAGTKWIHLGNAMGTVRLMRQLGRDVIADELMNHWIELAKRENKELLNPRQSFLSAESNDANFMKAVREAYSSEKCMPTLMGAIKDMSSKNGWSQEQIDVLSNASVEDYFDFFKAIGVDSNLDSYIKTCTQFGSFSSDEEKYKKIYATSCEALRRIARESRLNAIRVSRFLPGELA